MDAGVDAIVLSSDDDDASCDCWAARRGGGAARCGGGAARCGGGIARRPRLTMRGPKITGDEPYDESCVFANQVGLNDAQVAHLEYETDKKEPTVPFYVCTMKKSNIDNPKAKMVFSKSFSKAYLNKYLAHGRYVQVSSKKFQVPDVYMKVDKGKGKRAMITTNWKLVVQAFGMKTDDIYFFWLRRAAGGGLKMAVKKV